MVSRRKKIRAEFVVRDENVLVGFVVIEIERRKQFFTEYGKDLIKNNLLNDFIHLTNLYGFEINSSSISKYIISLKASGIGRACLIHLIALEKWHIGNAESWPAISKLCCDYSKC